MRKIIILVSFFIFSSFQDTSVIRGHVIRVIDGDTILILTEDNQELRVRLEGIDCPESCQDYYVESTQLTYDLTFDKNVSVIDRGRDSFKRTLGVVLLSNGTNVNKELLKAGLAWHFKKYNNEEELAQLEANAKSQRIGLWINPAPVAPDTCRAIKCCSPASSNNIYNVGDNIEICDTPSEITQPAQNGHIYINYGNKYPNQNISAVILSPNRSNFPSDIITLLSNNNFCVSGVVSTYINRQQIRLESFDQIELQ